MGSDPFKPVKTGADVDRETAFPVRAPVLPAVPEKVGRTVFGATGCDVLVFSRKVGRMHGCPHTFIGKALGVPAAPRNWSTVLRIVEKYSGK